MTVLALLPIAVVLLLTTGCKDHRGPEAIKQDRPAHPQTPYTVGPTTTYEPVGSAGATMTQLTTEETTP